MVCDLHQNSTRCKGLKAPKRRYYGAGELLTDKDVQVLNGWTNRYGKSRKWKLCYGEEQGSYTKDAKNFHKYCDGKGPTISVVQLKNGPKLGGFNPITWAGSGLYGSGLTGSKGAFIFRLTDKSGKPSRKAYRCNNSNRCLYRSSSRGPVFGDNDLMIRGPNDCSSSYNRSPYSIPYGIPYYHNTYLGSPSQFRNYALGSDSNQFGCSTWHNFKWSKFEVYVLA